MTADEEYPSAREALFGNDHAANLYCACKWLLWHLFHLLFVVTGAILLAIVVPFMLLYRGLRYVGLRGGGWLARRLGPRTERVTARSAGTLTAAGESARTTPVTRRIYGECPVSIKVDPRWFERVTAAGESIVDWAEPPETVWVCQTCGNVRDMATEPLRCYDCRDGAFEEEVKSEVGRTLD